ncbi:CubicO group peptidase (beta-lactamase class C family) [Thermobifida halotolerans]
MSRPPPGAGATGPPGTGTSETSFPDRPASVPARSLTVGAGGVVTTAGDVARWLVAQNSGGVGAGGVRVPSRRVPR